MKKINLKTSQFLVSFILSLGLVTSLHWPLQANAQHAAVKGLPDFTELVEQVGPSVVNIRTLEKARPQNLNGSGMDEETQELFRRFFGIPIPNPGTPNAPRQAPRQGRCEALLRAVFHGSRFISG